MRFLFLDRYDFQNPKAGGAERFTYNLIKQLIKAGHKVTWFTSCAKDQSEIDSYDGIDIVRRGNLISVIYHAFKYYKKHGDNFDYVIDEIHAIPFFTPLYVTQDKRLSLIYEVTGIIWFFEFPILPKVLGIFGYMFERLYMRFLYNKERFFTESKSAKDNLIRYGIQSSNVNILLGGIDIVDVLQAVLKNTVPQIFYSGGMRKLKRVTHQLKALKILKKYYPKINLVILGSKKGKYFQKLYRLVSKYDLSDNVTFTGYISDSAKVKFIKSSWLAWSTSIKEGWGLNLVEAAKFGVPGVAYDVPGSKDVIIDKVSGLLTRKNTPMDLADNTKNILDDKVLLDRLSKGAENNVKKMSWDKCGEIFKQSINCQ